MFLTWVHILTETIYFSNFGPRLQPSSTQGYGYIFLVAPSTQVFKNDLTCILWVWKKQVIFFSYPPYIFWILRERAKFIFHFWKKKKATENCNLSCILRDSRVPFEGTSCQKVIKSYRDISQSTKNEIGSIQEKARQFYLVTFLIRQPITQWLLLLLKRLKLRTPGRKCKNWIEKS